MKIVHDHNMENREAIKRVDNNLEKLLPNNVEISNFNKRLHYNILSFSFDVSIGLLNPTVYGKIKVSDEQIKLELELPDLISAVTNEDAISEAIKEKLIELFPNN
ncbi:polyhydroxyalkanoic acid system family protein [Candidatus Parcubacteria bacterium]|nr:polyhydroxyalkanoic acid system family protein [Candidatus Parcubacteria bacterium]